MRRWVQSGQGYRGRGGGTVRTGVQRQRRVQSGWGYRGRGGSQDGGTEAEGVQPGETQGDRGTECR